MKTLAFVAGGAVTFMLLRKRSRSHQVAVTAEEWEKWNRDGFFVRRGFFCPRLLDALRPHVNPTEKARIVADDTLRSHVVWGNPSTGEDSSKIMKLEQLRDCLPFRGLFELAIDSRLKNLARQLMGPRASLAKDKFIFKGAGQGGGFTPHQDMQYVSGRFWENALSFAIAFDDADEENGALQLVPNMQHELHGKLIAPEMEHLPICAQIANKLNFVVQPLRKGDLLCFSAWVVHRSMPNNSQTRDRAVYYPTYAVPPQRSHQDHSAPYGDPSAVYDDYYAFAWKWWNKEFHHFPGVTGETQLPDALVPGKISPPLHPMGYQPLGTGHDAPR